MANADIIEGLRYALSRGDTIEKAMMTFYNAGYSKTDVEEAAGIIKTPGSSFQVQPTPASAGSPPSRLVSSFVPPIQKQSSPIVYETQQVQRQPQMLVPNYIVGAGQTRVQSSTGKMITIVLIFMLFILLGLLVTVFIFKDALIKFLSGVL